jgi:2,3-dihydroxybenzoate-AMP ligase
MFDTVPTWPTDVAARYRALGYWRGTGLTTPLSDFARDTPDAVALVDSDGKTTTYAELDRAVDRMAVALRRWGLADRDRVLLQLPNVTEFVVLLLGMVRMGAVPVMILPAHREQEVVHLAERSGAVAHVVPDVESGFDYRELSRRVRERVPGVARTVVVGDGGDDPAVTTYAELTADDDLPPCTFDEPDPSQVALFLLSGGTGGLPKLIGRTHDDYAYNARASAEVCGLDRSTVYLAALSLAHNFPLACPGLLGTFGVGGKVVLARVPSPDLAFRLIAEHRVTITALVPTLVGLWLEAREFDDTDLSSLQTLQVGGAKLPETVAARIPGVLAQRVQQVYGMAEGLLNYTRSEDSLEIVQTTQGRPLSPDDEVRVVDPEGADVAPGTVGELWTRGPYTIRGYAAAPEANARSFTADGFYRTGDLVRQLPSGHLIVEGRAGDQINRGAEKFSAEEIENHLLDHPGVRQVALVGIPDPDLGQVACAVVRPADSVPALHDLTRFLRGRGVATFKVPDRLEIVDTLPLTRFGKVDRKAIVARLSARAGGPSRAEPG